MLASLKNSLKHYFKWPTKKQFPKKPSIIFIDEIDSLVSARSDSETEASRRVKTEFLVQMQGVSNSNDTGVLVLGATNLPWGLDSAMRRRFEKRIYIPLPEVSARLYLLKNNMKNEQHNLTDADFELIANKCDFFSGSDMSALIKNACYEPLRRFQSATHFKHVELPDGRKGWTPCNPQDEGAQVRDKATLKSDEIVKNVIDTDAFVKAVGNTKPTVGPGDLKKYEEWTKEFGMDG